jgi:Ser-tRNA(Ala) deacylase AlaX
MDAAKGRLDFDLPNMEWTKDDITQRLNELISNRIAVTTTLVAPENRASLLGLVRNRYALPPETPDAIKVIEIESIDVQPCGGTHVANTGEIPRVVCEKIEKKGRQNRRIVLRFAA